MDMEKKDFERRKEPRLIHFEFAKFYAVQHSVPLSALIVDVSLGGAQIRTRAKCNEGESCRIQIQKDDHGHIEIPGQISYCLETGGSNLYAVGVKFLPVTMGQKNDIANYVHNIFLEQNTFLAQEPPA